MSIPLSILIKGTEKIDLDLDCSLGFLMGFYGVDSCCIGLFLVKRAGPVQRLIA